MPVQAFPGTAVGCEQAGLLLLAAPGGQGLGIAGSWAEGPLFSWHCSLSGTVQGPASIVDWVFPAGGASRMDFTAEVTKNWGTGHIAHLQRAPGVLPWRQV